MYIFGTLRPKDLEQIGESHKGEMENQQNMKNKEICKKKSLS